MKIRNTRVAYVRHICNSSILARKKLPSKIPLTFPFGRIHFNNVSAEAVFHGGHLFMFSDRPLKDALCNTSG